VTWWQPLCWGRTQRTSDFSVYGLSFVEFFSFFDTLLCGHVTFLFSQISKVLILETVHRYSGVWNYMHYLAVWYHSADFRAHSSLCAPFIYWWRGKFTWHWWADNCVIIFCNSATAKSQVPQLMSTFLNTFSKHSWLVVTWWLAKQLTLNRSAQH